MRWWTRATLTALILSTLTGCSTIIATSGLSHLSEIPKELSKKDIQERFGSPTSLGTTNLGRETETYRIRRKLVEKSPYSSPLFLAACLIPVQYNPCLAMAVAEPILFPFVLARSEKEKFEVAFVYREDGRVLYHYETNSDPSWRYKQALSLMTHPLNNIEEANCPKLIVCMEDHIEEARNRAHEVGYALTSENESTFQLDLEIAQGFDESKMTKEEALIIRRPPPFHSTSQALTGGLSLYAHQLCLRFDPCLATLLDYQRCGATEYGEQKKISSVLHNAIYKLTDRLLDGIQDSHDGVSDAVAEYIEEFRKLVAEFSYTLTCADEVTFQLETEIAKNADEGMLTREQALSKLRMITPRHLVNFIRGRPTIQKGD